MMRTLLADALARLAGWLRPKNLPPALAGAQWSGTAFVDAYKRNRNPTPNELLAELKNTAWTCASINAAACATYPPRLYVATHNEEPEARCLRAPISSRTEERLRALPYLPTRLTKAYKIEEVLRHPLLELLRQVNPVHNQYDLFELTTLYQEVLGSAYWYLSFNVLGVPDEIWILPAQNVTPRREPNSPRL